ncbi:hypothetical protein B0O99DRAFT_670558 [Bisporella sp. PMI_857]|nr:hypothetical protein B0O99DRAFT_670558 [Bisporella sp. PMI_857]
MSLYPNIGQTAMASPSLYSGFTTEVLIPFVASEANSVVPFTDRVRVALTVGSGPSAISRSPSLDTGTCGFVLSTTGIPNWPPANLSDYPIGWEFLSSSKKLYSGHWIPEDIYFGNAGVEVKARIPILAVEDTVICPNYNETTDTNSCPTPVEGTPPTVTHLPEGISLFGVGFGRQADGQPQGDPDKNAFLNVLSINGISTEGDHFRNGYLITKDGITVGLTASNTNGFSFVDLKEGIHHSTHPLDWKPVPACIAVDAMTCVNGTALIDTGITHSYLTLPLGSPVNRHTAKSPSSNADVQVLDENSYVQVRFDTGTGRIDDNFTVVNSTTTSITDHTPNLVITTLASPAVRPPYINTGTHFLRTWDVAFDAVGGRFGFREI